MSKIKTAMFNQIQEQWYQDLIIVDDYDFFHKFINNQKSNVQ